MPIAPVQVIAPQQEYETKKGKKGGSRTGQAIGGVIGGAVGAVAGMAAGNVPGAIAGGIAGTSTGASVGGMIGERISPSREASTTAIQRRSDGLAGPQIIQNETTEKLKSSLMALRTQPDEVRAQYTQPLVQAYMTAVAQANPKPQGMA